MILQFKPYGSTNYANFLQLGNKCDLEEQRQVQFEQACNLAKDRGILAALETSAKVKSEFMLWINTQISWIHYLTWSVSSVRRRARTLKRPSSWWPGSCFFVMALMSTRWKKRRRAHLGFYSGKTRGQLMAQGLPTQHQRRSHAADTNANWKKDWRWQRRVNHEYFRSVMSEDTKMDYVQQGLRIWGSVFWEVLAVIEKYSKFIVHLVP